MNPPRRAGAKASSVRASRSSARVVSLVCCGDTCGAFSSTLRIEESLGRAQGFLGVLVGHALQSLLIGKELAADVLVADLRLGRLRSRQEEHDRLLDQPLLAI